MRNITTKNRVSIKAKKHKVETERLYLVCFKAGKRIWYATHEFVYTNPTDTIQINHNETVYEKVEGLRQIKEKELFNEVIDTLFEKTVQELEYWKNIAKQHLTKESFRKHELLISQNDQNSVI